MLIVNQHHNLYYVYIYISYHTIHNLYMFIIIALEDYYYYYDEIKR